MDGKFGAGIYFAEKAAKSDQYCQPASQHGASRNWTFHMFVARACLGAPYKTSSSMGGVRHPPEMRQRGFEGRVFDSVVYRPGGTNFSEFIVYDKAQTYPEYLIEFNRR